MTDPGQQRVLPLTFRKPRRISITIPDHTYGQLLEQSNQQGRSISNLAAFLLERAMTEASQQQAAHGLTSATAPSARSRVAPESRAA